MVRKPGRALRMTTAAAVVVLALSGCGVFEQPLEEPLRAQVKAVLIPSAEIEAALDVTVSACAAKHGWDRKVTSPYRGIEALGGPAGLFGDARIAERVGYLSTMRNPLPGEADMSAEQDEKVTGSYAEGRTVGFTSADDTFRMSMPEHGCVAEAALAVFGTHRDFLTAVAYPYGAQDVPRSAGPSIRRALREGAEAYGACMRRGGREFDLGDASAYARQEWGQYRKPGERPHAAEIELVRADAACQAEAGLQAKIEVSVLRSARNWVQGREAEIAAAADVIRKAQLRAELILSK